MRPETGNNRPVTDRKVSIQQPLDGHSFSLPEGPNSLPADASVEVELLMPRTLLVPDAACDPAYAEEWFAACGMPLSAEECVVTAESRNGCTALIALRCDLLQRLREKWGEKIRFTTPLLHLPASPQRCVWMARMGGLTYVKLYDSELEFADVLPTDDDTELLYFVERLGGCFPLGEYTLCIGGDDARAVRHLLGKRFKRIVCE